jgi:outer membrane protein assembly factor BamB
MEDDDLKKWQSQVQKVGFRQTAVAFLRKRLSREERKEYLDQLILLLSKYEPRANIIDHLYSNPVWGRHLENLISALPEVTVNPEIQFIFQGGGNIPNIPVVGQMRLYFGSGENFHALDAETGTVIWRIQSPGKTWSIACLSKDSLYMCSAGRLHAISPLRGQEKWCFEADKELTSPYSHHGKVFVGSEQGTLYALDSGSGTRDWTFNVAGPIYATKGIWGNTIFSVSRDGALFAIRARDGECLWQFKTSGKIYALPYISKGMIYLSSADHNLYALNSISGHLHWSFRAEGEVHTSPFEKDGIVYVGSRDKHLYALRAEDGKKLWQRKMYGYPSSPTATRGMVYFSAQGRVYGFSVADHKMRWCFPVGFSIATSPLVVYKRIYTGTLEGKLICLKLETRFEEHRAAQVLEQFMEIRP